MSTTKHSVKIYPSYNNNDGLIVIPPSLNSYQAQSMLNTVQSGHQIARTYHTGSTLKSIYAQLHNNNKITTKKIVLIEFNQYEKNTSPLNHMGELTSQNFEKFLSYRNQSKKYKTPSFRWGISIFLFFLFSLLFSLLYYRIHYII